MTENRPFKSFLVNLYLASIRGFPMPMTHATLINCLQDQNLPHNPPRTALQSEMHAGNAHHAAHYLMYEQAVQHRWQAFWVQPLGDRAIFCPGLYWMRCLTYVIQSNKSQVSAPEPLGLTHLVTERKNPRSGNRLTDFAGVLLSPNSPSLEPSLVRLHRTCPRRSRSLPL